ncbi:hypothetical protein RB601_005519 [Gaeumannomyces tritici]
MPTSTSSRLFYRDPRRLLCLSTHNRSPSTALRRTVAPPLPLLRSLRHTTSRYSSSLGNSHRRSSSSSSRTMAAPTTPTPATSRPRGQMRLRPARPEESVAIARVHFDAFGSSPMASLLHGGPGGVSEQTVRDFASDLFPGPDHDEAAKGERLLTVAEFVPEGDGDGGEQQQQQQQPELVAFAKWTIYRRERTAAQWDVEEPAAAEEEAGGSSSAVVLDAFIGDLHRTARALAKGEPHMHLNILACKKAHAGLGAGTALLRAGLELADELGLPTRLESSPLGYRLYARHGFEPVAAQDLEIARRWGKAHAAGENWGHGNAVEVCGPAPEGCYRSVFMRRPAKAL